MERDHDQRLSAELLELAERLREERPSLGALELDRLRLRIRGSAGRGSQRKDTFMRSRLVIMLMLLFGVFLTVGGTGLAVNGLSGRGSAATAQYGDDDDHGDDDHGDDDDDDDDGDDSGDDTAGGGGPPPSLGVLPQTQTNPPEQGVENETATNPVQASRQVQSTGEQQLPFTGYAAIPILLLGIALLTAGLVARRRAQVDERLE